MRNLPLLFILFAGLSGFLILWDTTPEMLLAPATQAPQQLPEADSYMKTTESVKFTVNGDREFRLTTKESRFFEKQAYWQADMPYLIAYDKSNKNHPWELKADQGEILGQGKEIKLLKNVVGWQYAGIDHKNEFRTSELIFYPKKQFAKTDQYLTLSSREGITSATGMTADFSSEVFTLLSNVKGRYRAP